MLTLKPSDGFEKYLCDQAFENEIPIEGTFELLPLCNMDCRMCYIRMSKEEMDKVGVIQPVDFWINVAKKMKKHGLLFVLLTGGEPLLYNGFKELYKAISSMGMIITINTNGTLINDEIIELWKEYPPRRVNVSLYGASDETYSNLCRNPKGFTQTMTNIKKMIDAKLQVKINYTISRANVHELDQVISITENLNLPISTPTYMFPPARKEKNSLSFNDYRLSPKEVAEIQYKIIKHGILEKPESVVSIKNMLDKIQADSCVNEYAIETPKGFLCSAGVRSFWINWKGIMTPCGMISHIGADLHKLEPINAWNKIKEESKSVETSNKCFHCSYRSICENCGASSLLETGEISNAPEYHCTLSEEYKNNLEKLLKEFGKEYIDENK